MPGKRKLQQPVQPEEFASIRAALRESVEVHSLRGTARELSMSPTGLRGVIDGNMPYVKTLRRARAWYATWLFRHGATDKADELAISVLVSTMEEEDREGAAEQLRQKVAQLRRREEA
jgi:hypothetical protein